MLKITAATLLLTSVGVAIYSTQASPPAPPAAQATAQPAAATAAQQSVAGQPAPPAGVPASFRVQFRTSAGDVVNVVAPYFGATLTGNRIDRELVWSIPSVPYRFQTGTETFTSGVVEVHCFADNVPSPIWALVIGGGQYRVTISGTSQTAPGNFNLAFAPGTYYGITYDSIVVGP